MSTLRKFHQEDYLNKCSLVKMGREAIPILEGLECGPREEQWIFAQLGCILHDFLDVEQDNCIEDTNDMEPKDEIFKCDAREHPNIVVSKITSF